MIADRVHQQGERRTDTRSEIGEPVKCESHAWPLLRGLFAGGICSDVTAEVIIIRLR